MYNNKVPQTLKEQELYHSCRKFEDAVRIYGADEVLKALDTDILARLVRTHNFMYDIGE